MATLVASPPTTTPRGPSEMSHPFTCNTCQVAFRSSKLQRTHMQSDWHRYNLKRRVASLPPLTSEVFNDKVLANQASAAATAAKAAFEKICVPCQRTYFSENAYQNHLGSQKHKTKVSQLAAIQADVLDDDATSMTSSALSLGEPISLTKPSDESLAEAEFSDVISGLEKSTLQDNDETPAPRRPHRPSHSVSELREEHPLSPEKSRGTDETEAASSATERESSVQSCLFCNAEASTLEANVVHMERVHSLFIPERFYLVDLPGLIGYLHDKVSILHECLFCGQLKRTTEGAKTHMRDKGHCMIAFESEEEMIEVGQFYDFRSTYSDDELEDDDDDDIDMPQTSGVKLGAARVATSRFVPVGQDTKMDEEDSDDGEGWETDGSEEEDDDDDSEDAAHSTRKPERAAKAAPQSVYYDDFELHLPSGRTAGHRSLARYYRQNLTRHATAAEREAQLAIQDADAATSEQEQQPTERGRELTARSTREQGLLGLSQLQRREVQTVEFRERKKAQRAETRYRWGNEKRGNAQKHYRDQLLQ